MSTLTIRLTKTQDQEMVKKLMEQYGLTQSSKALVAAGHDVVTKLPELQKETVQQRAEISKLRQVLRNIIQDNKRIAEAKQEFVEDINYIIKKFPELGY